MINEETILNDIPGNSVQAKKKWLSAREPRIELAMQRAYGFTESIDNNRSNIIETYNIINFITDKIRLRKPDVQTFNNVEELINLLKSIGTSFKCSFKIKDWKSVYNSYMDRFARMNIILPEIIDVEDCEMFKEICINNIMNCLKEAGCIRPDHIINYYEKIVQTRLVREA